MTEEKEDKWRQRNEGQGKGEKGEKTIGKIKSKWADVKPHEGRKKVGRKESGGAWKGE